MRFATRCLLNEDYYSLFGRVHMMAKSLTVNKMYMLKKFIDDQGIFEISVPFTWKYSLQNSNVHTFQEYEIWKSDAFQISIHKVKDDDYRRKFEDIAQKMGSIVINGVKYYEYPQTSQDGFTIKAWTLLMNDNRVLFTYNRPDVVDSDLDSRSDEEKIKTALECIASFRLIGDAERVDKLKFYRFDMFLQGVGATSLILKNALENKAFIEATCLLASQIDALLRIGIVLKNQIVNNNTDIDLEWIYQGLSDKKKSEKDVYNKAKDLGILTDEVFNRLYTLYDDRNRVIHRFIISEITLAEVEEISYKYYQMREKCNDLVYDIEKEQIALNVGMTKKHDGSDGLGSSIDFIKGKIGKQNYFETKPQKIENEN